MSRSSVSERSASKQWRLDWLSTRILTVMGITTSWGRGGYPWIAAIGLTLSSCTVGGTAGEQAVDTSVTSPISTTSEPSPTTSESTSTSTVLVEPALPDIPIEFERRAQRVFAALSDWGYDTNTGESDSASVMARHLTPLQAGSDLPTMSLSVEWGQDEPYGDRKTVSAVDTSGVVLNVLDMEHDGAGLWFRCDEMVVVLWGKVTMETLQEFAVDLHHDACS